MIILGIDPGTNITGYGLITTDGYIHQIIDYGCIRPSPTLPTAVRYLTIMQGVEELIAKHSPQAVCVETQFMHKNAQSALKLGMARASAMLAAAKNGIPVFEYAPKKAKLAVVGNGSASKEQVQKMIQHLLHLAELPTPQDAADALSLALCHAHQLHSLQTLNGAVCMNI